MNSKVLGGEFGVLVLSVVGDNSLVLQIEHLASSQRVLASNSP